MTLLRILASSGEAGPAVVSAAHSGNMGDIVYAIPTLRRLGVDTVYLNLCEDPGIGRRVLTRAGAEFLAPLLLAQPEIRRVHVAHMPVRFAQGVGADIRGRPMAEGMPLELFDPEALGITYLLDRFRLQPADRLHLTVSHARAAGLSSASPSQFPAIVPGHDPARRDGPVVVSLTPRARHLPGSFFAALLDRLPVADEDIVLIGTESDRPCFAGLRGRFHTAGSALELAGLIAGSRLFIGSQSMPCALAEVLETPRLIDVPVYPVVGFPVGRRGWLLPMRVAEAGWLAEQLLADPDGAPRPAAFATATLVGSGTDKPVRPPRPTATLYWRAGAGYDDQRRVTAELRPSLQPQRLEFPVSVGNATVQAVRLTLGDAAAAFAVATLAIADAQGGIHWHAPAPHALLARGPRRGIVLEQNGNEAILVQSDPQPWIEIPLPPEARRRLRGNRRIILDLRRLTVTETVLLAGRLAEQGSRETERLQGEADQLHRDKAGLQAQTARLKIQLEEAEGQRHALLTSTSWRVTGPLRRSVYLIRGMRGRLRRLQRAGLVAWLRGLAGRSALPGLEAEELGSLSQVLALAAQNPQTYPFPLAVQLAASRLRRAGRTVPQALALRLDAAFKARQDKLAPPEVAAMAVAREGVQAPQADDCRSVAVIVCIHNALEDVRRCLTTVVATTTRDQVQLILVDDGSGPDTADYVRRFAAVHQADYQRNDVAGGYTAAANAGLARSTADLSILLNSDTIPTAGWIDGLLACANADRRVGIVGPLSNTASWQSVPTIFNADGDWADNPLPAGLTVESFAALVAGSAGEARPILPFINGFCLGIKRRLIAELGTFNPAFANFGEENDFCLRAAAKGWLAAVAHDTYVYHAQSKSYSHEKRAAFVAKSDALLREHHDGELIGRLAQCCAFSTQMASHRARITAAVRRRAAVLDGLHRFGGNSVAFLLPATDGGGCAVIAQEAVALARMGVGVTIVNLEPLRPYFLAANHFGDAPVQFVFVPDMQGIIDHLSDNGDAYDAVIATHNTTVALLAALPPEQRPFRCAYYVQDYEPLFYPVGHPERQRAEDSYTAVEGLCCFTKSTWNHRMLRDHHDVDAHIVGPSVDLDLFRPRREKNPSASAERIAIAAMVRPATPRRAPEQTFAALQRAAQRFGERVQVYSFGCTDDELQALPGAGSGLVHHLGILDRQGMADLLGRIDIFLDLSHFQAMGLTALEAMISGCATVLPAKTGVSDFAMDGENALLVDVGDAAAVDGALARLIDDARLRETIQRTAVETACGYTCEEAAVKMLEAVLSSAEEA